MAEWPCCYDPLRVSLCPRIFPKFSESRLFFFFPQMPNPQRARQQCPAITLLPWRILSYVHYFQGYHSPGSQQCHGSICSTWKVAVVRSFQSSLNPDCFFFSPKVPNAQRAREQPLPRANYLPQPRYAMGAIFCLEGDFPGTRSDDPFTRTTRQQPTTASAKYCIEYFTAHRCPPSDLPGSNALP